MAKAPRTCGRWHRDDGDGVARESLGCDLALAPCSQSPALGTLKLVRLEFQQLFGMMASWQLCCLFDLALCKISDIIDFAANFS